MTHRWNQTINMNEELARKLITSQQEIHVESIIKLEEGWDNIAYLVNHHLIFRFPRREAAINCMKNEIAVVPYIAQHVSFSISAPSLIGKPSTIYPYVYAGYPMLSGQPLTEAHDAFIHDKSFAETIASWLREIHQIPIENKHRAALKDSAAWRLDFSSRASRSQIHLSQYADYFQEAGFDPGKLWDICLKLESFQFSDKQCFIHGDFYHRHLLVNDHLKPTGIIDWGDVQIGDPGIDLEIAFIFTPKVYEHFLASYNADDNILKSALFNAFFGFISFLPYAFERNVDSFKHWSIMSLRRILEELRNFND